MMPRDRFASARVGKVSDARDRAGLYTMAFILAVGSGVAALREGPISNGTIATMAAVPWPDPPLASGQTDSPLPPALDPAAPPRRANDSWLKSAVAALERQEYHRAPATAGLHAPNRAHNLRIYFREHVVEIVPRNADAGAPLWHFGWEPTRWGRPDHLAAALPVRAEPEGPRVIYRRPGLVEWARGSRSRRAVSRSWSTIEVGPIPSPSTR